jgi:hypothetical protein
MRCSLLCFALMFVAPPLHAGEIAVNWKAEPGGFVAENRLPPAATVKIRVGTLDDAKSPVEFSINGEKYTARKEGDEFRGKVDGNGRLVIQAGTGGIGTVTPDCRTLTGELLFGKHIPVGKNLPRWRLGLFVAVVD